MSEFTWIPFYKELADKLLMYRDRQDELNDPHLEDEGFIRCRLEAD
jgi:hypothetical protein